MLARAARLLRAVLVLTCAATAAAPVTADDGPAGRLVLDRADSTYALDGRLEVWVDTSGRLGWDDVRWGSGFGLPDASSLRGGPRTVFWMRLHVHSTLAKASRWRLDLPADSAEVRLFDAGGRERQRAATGYRIALADRAVQQGFPPSVELEVPASAEHVLIARVRVGRPGYAVGSGALVPPKLRPAGQVARQTMDVRLGQGLFLGFMLAMLGYNLFLFLSVHDRGYLWYVVFLGCFTLFWALHYGFPQEWWWPAGASTMPDLLFFVIPLGFAAYLRFTQHMLGTRTRAPWLHHVSMGVMALAVVPAGLALAGRWPEATLAAAVLALVVVAVTTVTGLRVLVVSGYRPARYYFAACLFFIAGTVVYTTMWLGALPVNTLTRYSMQMGSAMEAFVLSLGLAARIKGLRDETRQARVRARRAEETQHVLEEAHRVKNELVGLAAHDMRSPLMAIRDFSDIVREEAAAVRAVHEPLDLIRSAAVRMLRLVDDLLTSAVLESGQARMRREETDLVALVEEVVRTYGPTAGRKAQRLVLHVPDAADVIADAVRVRNAVDNLVSNALKYAPPETEVEVRVERRDGEAVVTVRDEGPGLTDDDLARVFQPYQRLSARPTGGEDSTGLGLSITRRVVELHGGRVWVDTELGRGSTFALALPLAEHAEAAPAA